MLWNGLSRTNRFVSAARVPQPVNEPNLTYLPGSPERAELKARLASMVSERIDIPLVIGGCEVRTSRVERAVMPHDHRHVLADWHKAEPQHVEQAIVACARAHRAWSAWTLEERAAVFLRAAELLTTTWRSTVNAATMLGQSKTVFQAEIDAASELIDFWRFNPAYAEELYAEQPISTHAAVEPHGVPGTRRVRLCGDAVQLHLDRRQSSYRSGTDGEHGHLEAGGKRRGERLLHHAAARGSGAPARRHQLRSR